MKGVWLQRTGQLYARTRFGSLLRQHWVHEQHSFSTTYCEKREFRRQLNVHSNAGPVGQLWLVMLMTVASVGAAARRKS
jgi:hypothetical protein